MDFCKNCGLIEKFCRCDNKIINNESKILRFYFAEELITAWIEKNKVKNRKGEYFHCNDCNNPILYNENKIFCPKCNNDYFILKKFFQDDIKHVKDKKIRHNEKIKHVDDILDLKFKKNHVKAFKKSEFQSDLFQFDNDSFKDKNLKAIDISNIPNLFEAIFLLLTSNPQFYKEDFKLLLKKLYNDFSNFSKEISQNNSYLDDFNINDYINESDNEFIVNINGNYSIFNIILDENKPFINQEINDYSIEEIFFRFLSSSNPDTLNYNLQYWNLIYEFTLKLIENHAFIPEIIELNSGKFHIRWIPAIFSQEIENISEKFLLSCPDDLIIFNGTKISNKQQFLSSISFIFSGFLELFKKYYMSDQLKNNLAISTFALFLNENTSLNGNELLINQWLLNLSKNKSTYDLILVINDFNENFFIELLIRYGNSIKYTSDLLSHGNDIIKKNLLSDIAIIREIILEIDDGIGLKKLDIGFNIDDISAFFKKIEPLSKTLGISIIPPKNLENIFKPRLVLNFKENNNKKTEFFSIKNIISFDWEIAIGSKNYSKNEFEKLLNKSEDFIDFNLLNNESMKLTLNKLENAPKELDKNDLLQGLLSGKVDDINVNVDTNLDNLIDKIQSFEKIDIPSSLNGNLRPYQINGYYWLVQNIQLGFGSILADDMGLGKTIQVLTTILYLKENSYLDNEKVLVIAPTSLLFNWEKEIEKFTPSLKSFIYHNQNRTFPEDDDYDIILTSYGILRKDKEDFKALNWFLIVVDEAHNIKNPNAKQTKAVKSIKSTHKIALTGTPIENRLSEYWSIFDFTNKNYLHSAKKFKRKFINPIEKDKDDRILNDFKHITSPFILRRLKKDKNIINDLPDKNINDIYCNLTVQQAALYQKTLEISLDEISYEQGIGRKGLIFKLINSLKQICNHPSQFLKSTVHNIEDSGKMEVLIETLENINDIGEKTLIFTQYVQMGKIMKKILEDKFKKEILFLHGSLSREKRDEMINEFQNNPDKKIFILSLKVGGVGLNLTAAQNVIHYDLWWNPAVENQATDRAYRIGQKKNVMVYRLITSGTFEEQINDLLKEKEELAELAIGSGEKFLTEMTNNELKDMFSLR